MRGKLWAYAAMAWCLIFAVRGAYWALGGTAGIDTVAPGVRDYPGIRTILWVTVVLELVGAALALALTRPRRAPGWLLLLPAWGAGALLAGHGLEFVSFGALTAAGVFPRSAQTLWYALMWGPWFLLGGVLFMAAGWAYLRADPARRTSAVLASGLGAFAGAAVAAAPLVLGIG